MKSKVQLICLTVQHLGWICLYTEKVHRNSRVPFLILAIIHTLTCSCVETLQINVIYVMGQFTPRAQIRMIYCTGIFFLQNRSKCSPCYTQIHIYMFTSTFAHVLDQFKFLPTFSHLHGVWETPEQSRKPCGRIRKWSISENTAE